ncbi:UNVERIFIED_ORG: hypothetical protein BTE55_23330 [Rhizobium sophorae]
MGALDPCDEHRDEGGEVVHLADAKPLCATPKIAELAQHNKKGGASGTALDRSIRSMPASSKEEERSSGLYCIPIGRSGEETDGFQVQNA